MPADEGAASNAGIRLAKRLFEAGVHFEGRAYPASPEPLILDEEDAARISSTAEALHQIIDRVVDAYLNNAKVRSHFPHYLPYAHLMTLSPQLRPAARICRFDGATDHDGTYRIMETNTACPGGVIQNGITARLWREECGPSWCDATDQWIPQVLETDRYAFTQELIQCHVAQSGREPGFAVVVNLNGRFTNEVDWMLTQFREHGLRAERVEAADLRYRKGRLIWRGSTVDLAYNKLDQLDLVRDEAAHGYLQAAADGAVCCLNPLISQCILEDKAVLALLTDERFADSLPLNPGERAIVERHVPWTRALEECETTGPDGAVLPLMDFAVKARSRLVLKPRHLTRGEGVAVGRWTDSRTWQSLLSQAARTQDYVVQDYVPLPTCRIAASGTTDGGDMMHGLDVYLFGGKAVGFQCRASYDPVTNIGRRGMLLPVAIRRFTGSE
ncbi:glutathionylspermidine synthase family protein [Streptomyces sp. NPDC094034]|uniref:glutathionylspermidine synthase family protein n=1 Tax=Streptomyces sp. NPDC094034 TaxID=3155309 RepID=UPI00332B643B